MKLNNPAPSTQSSATELVDKPIIITEIKGTEMVETKLGDAEAMRVDVLVLGGFPGEEDLTPVGDVLIFWQVVKAQLAESTVPIAGKVTMHGRAYVLDPLSPEELKLITKLA